jgi:CheY-like chemotaxis protein/Tfp pilus assembly protein PilZ
MKKNKILITDDVKVVLDRERSFLGREGVTLFSASTNDELFRIHGTEKADLIIATLDTPGMKSEELYAAIRAARELCAVSVILLCRDEPGALERGEQCGANAVMTLPVDTALLLEKAQQLLDISWRESFRVLTSVRIEGANRARTFFCRSENLSASGILIETERVMAKGDQVVCSFTLPDSTRIKTPGEIVRVVENAGGSRMNRYGVKFAPLAPEAKASIDTYVERKSQVSTSRK